MAEKGDPVMAAEDEVVRQLKQVGWSIEGFDRTEESNDIEAVSGYTRILVKVKAAVDPYDPPNMSVAEMKDFVEKARNKNANAYQARVKLSQRMDRIGNIAWMKIK